MYRSNANLGIVVERGLKQITLFDTDTLGVLYHLPIGLDVLAVALTRDCGKALVSSFDDNTMVEIDLMKQRAVVTATQLAPTPLEDVVLTPDDRFGVSVDGSASPGNIVSYDLQSNTFISIIPADAQAVAVSPNGSGLVLTARYSENVVRRFLINNIGTIYDYAQEIPSGGANPINIVFSPDGSFAMVANYEGGNIGILNTQDPNNITLTGTAPTNALPQTIVVSRTGEKVFVLTATTVDIFNFDNVGGIMTPAGSFRHSLPIHQYFGTNQMALDPAEKRLFISSSEHGILAAFTTSGTSLGNVPGVNANGGVATCPSFYLSLLRLILFILL